MKSQLFNKRILTILTIVLALFIIPLTIAILKNQTSSKSKASNSEEPQNVKISNISDNSFTITYQTDAETTGSINYGKDKKLGTTELDDIDKEKGNFKSKNLHSISVKKLSPKTKYHVTIISGKNTFLDNGSPFEISTPGQISSSSAQQTIIIKGKVLLPDGNPAQEAIVYLSTENSQLLSTVTGEDGGFNFSLKSLLTKDLSSYLELDENTTLNLLAINNSLKSTVSFSLGKNNSIPTITLSQNYDFTHKTNLAATESAQLESVGFPSMNVKQQGSNPQILTPKKDQSFTDQRPVFRGTSQPNEKVKIIIHSAEEIEEEVTADSNGNWSYQPPTNLSPGTHTITIFTRDSSGILNTLAQPFTVFASETSGSDIVTPSINPTQIPIPTPIPTLNIPTIDLLDPTITPTLSPPVALIESKGGLPPTGSSSVFAAIGGIITTITGITLFLLTRAKL